ncbi:hypothetical protein K402DRAFT_395371 [Aulographum hederae CBS 113979]|uniref:ADP-ribosylation factor n=1 Tax=Aulographum hederae CBS 113979 TaxID=1176131 RepID=A0A6G1GUR7_9PEZI|nr:hypothetical protein K402DRAFT_395371 [Aulographum hederae CBS 113979]
MAATDQRRSSQALPSYYRQVNTPEVSHSFRNFDDPDIFSEFDRSVRQVHSKNFVLDFGDDEAWCGFDLGVDSIKSLLKADRPSSLSTRWINIWKPQEQDDVLSALAKTYDFSPRLYALMCSKPRKRRSTPSSSKASSSFTRQLRRQAFSRRQPQDSLDLEDQIGMKDFNPKSDLSFDRGINQYDLADAVWHWSSVDWGRSFLCLGFNSLYKIAPSNSSEEDEVLAKSNLPAGKRVWSWLILCDDKTVITIHEDPYAHLDEGEQLNAQDEKALLAVRRNLINVFRQCSKGYDASSDNPLMQLPIRRRVGEGEVEQAHRATDAPGLLFYCLFDDWYSTYSLVAKLEHQYSAKLNDLRECMFKEPELSHIDHLHHLGQQLSVLRRLYQSYEYLIDRVLEKREPTLASLKNSHVLTSGGMGSPVLSSGNESLDTSTYIATRGIPEEHLLGVSLSSAARVRFERLKYRIRLYALSEIQECLDLKDQMVMMNFNLVALNQTFFVERLTRVTLLVAKITVLFLPVSLMTAYFSCQFRGVEFTVSEYWVWFGVVIALSISGLAFFSFISGTMEGKLAYKSFSRKMYEAGRLVLRQRGRGKGKGTS